MDRAFLEVNVDALKHNVQKIEESIGRSKIMGVVKDQCYGLGMDAVFVLQEMGIDFFAVATLDEAIQLRGIGIFQPILIFGYTHPERFDELIEFDLIQTAVSVDYFMDLVHFNKPIKTHLKINTGMNRLGIPDDSDLVASLFAYEGVTICGIYTHLLSSDQPGIGHEKSLDQMKRFDELLVQLDRLGLDYGLTHVHNSAGIFYFGESHVYDYVRPGLLLADSSGFDGYRDVVSLKARVAMVKEVKAGENVGYGIEHVLAQDTRVATVMIGYGDGLQRRLFKTGFQLRVNGVLRPLIGRICMDQLLVDVGTVEVKQGDLVELIHDQFTVDQMAELLETIPNEILTQFQPRIERVLVYDKQEEIQ